MMHYEYRTIADMWNGTDTLTGVTFDVEDAVTDYDVVINPDGTIDGVVLTDNTIMTVTPNTVCYVECDGTGCDD